VKNGENPTSSIATGPTLAPMGDGAFETILNQVIGRCPIAEQSACVSAQGRNERFKE
jgi:hypothetical protein